MSLFVHWGDGLGISGLLFELSLFELSRVDLYQEVKRALYSRPAVDERGKSVIAVLNVLCHVAH